MIITKTPYRVSLFGGGTDHPSWYRENGGEVISFAIDKFCYLTTRILPPFFEHKYRIAYSKLETTSSIDDIKHPAVKAALSKYFRGVGLEIHHDGDLPARSGVGSSSAFAVGLIHSLTLLKDKSMSSVELANAAIELEQIDLKENVGSQDQIACALGGLNHIKFGGDSEWNSQRLNLPISYIQSIENRIVLIYTGISRSSSDIQSNFLSDIKLKSKALNRTAALANECKELFMLNGDLDLIGEMLVESWNLKKEVNSLSVTTAIEELWGKAMKAGALGGKILGAGGGGFLMFWVRDGARENFLREFKAGLYVPIGISEAGSTCVLK